MGTISLTNPCAGVKGRKEKGRKHIIYIEDELYNAAHQAASQPLKDAMDMAYLTGQRPADVLKMTERDIQDGAIIINQNKTISGCASVSKASSTHSLSASWPVKPAIKSEAWH